jgi:hypothetical protein
VRHVDHLPLPGALPSDPGPRLQSGAVRYAKQPTAQRLRRGDRSRLAGEYQKRRLKGVLGIVQVEQDAAAHAHDHRAVPAEECREGVFILLPDETSEQLRVGQAAAVLREGNSP